jgi:regulatory protein
MDADFPEKKKTYWSSDEAVLLIQKYCAFQERSHAEVRTKLLEHGIYGDLLEEIISDLICNNFLNEERFARTFARGKFRMKQWGKVKIQNELKLRQVSSYSINEAMKEIDETDYKASLRNVLAKKSRLTSFKNKFDRYKKLTDYALSKGYEYGLIKEVLDGEE